MRFFQSLLRGAAMLSIAGLSGVQAGYPAPVMKAHAISSDIQDYAAKNLDDFSATMRVTFHDDNAGRRINKDFGLIYKIQGDVLLRYKDENKLRLDGRIGASKACMIVSGTSQIVRLPGFGVNSRSDLGTSPGKRKTLLDVGLISTGYLKYTQAESRGTRPVDGVPCAVFKISYRDKSLDTSHRMVWIDPKTKVTLKREEYSQDGKLNATFYYKQPTEVAAGVWFPSSIEVYNNLNQKAGATAYHGVKVNIGLDDSVFQ